MNMKLIASAPNKHFDASKHLCSDGRGGWVFSQVNVDRTITERNDYWLLFFFGVLVEPANERDYVESTRIIARMDGETIGANTLDWKHPNPMWGYLNGNAVFEWPQSLTMQPTADGMIEISIEAKLNSQADWVPVDGHAYCQIQLAEALKLKNRWVSPRLFTMRSLFGNSFGKIANPNEG